MSVVNETEVTELELCNVLDFWVDLQVRERVRYAL